MKKKNIAVLVLGCIVGAYAIYNTILAFKDLNADINFMAWLLRDFIGAVSYILIAVYAILVGIGKMGKNIVFPGLAFTFLFIENFIALIAHFDISATDNAKWMVYVIMRIMRDLLLIPSYLIGLIKGFKGKGSFILPLIFYCIGNFFFLIGDGVYGGIGTLTLLHIFATILAMVTLTVLGKHLESTAKEAQ